MKVVFLSNLLTPHQIPFCNSMSNLVDEFLFIQENQTGASWEAKGETIRRIDYPYLHFLQEEPDFCRKKILEADVVIIGSVDLAVIHERLKSGKLVFVFLERFYKKGISLKNIVRVVGGTFLHHGRFQKHAPYLLCASGYCAGDAAIFGNYRERTLKWGYFPETYDADVSQLIENKKETSIAWAGRLLDWKHPDDMLLAAQKLKDRGYSFQLKLLGDGPMRNELEAMIDKYNLADCVTLYGNVPNEVVRREMMNASMFVATSDYGEGWGCVVNEAMNSACAVVASHAMGSAPFLIKDGENGFVYESGNVEELSDLCARLLASPQLCREIGVRAYEAISLLWNAQTAAERLCRVFQTLLDKKALSFEETGPCSYAEPVKQKIMYARMTYASRKQKDFDDHNPLSK